MDICFKISSYLGLFVIPVSHSGKIDLSINASTEVIKDQEELDRFTQVYFSEEIRKLHACLN